LADFALNVWIAGNDAYHTWQYATSPEGSTRLGIDTKQSILYGSLGGSALAGGLAIKLNKMEVAHQPTLTVFDRLVLLIGSEDIIM
jgi:hypothetical protein